MKFNDIVSLAKQVKKNVETKQSASVTYTRNYTTLAYLFSKAILNIGKDVGIKYVPENQKPQSGHVNGGIGIKNCQKLCQLYINWADKHNEAPAYLRFNDKKIAIWVWAYATAGIIIYYTEHNELPMKVHVSDSPFQKKKVEVPKKTFKKYGHATERGCDNIGQNNGYFCGPHSLQECIRNLTGKVISQSQLASWAGTTSDGSDHDGLNTAVAMASKKLGVKLTVKWYNFSELGWTGIKKIIESSNQDCVIHSLYRNKWGHYEVINKVYGNVQVQNSLGDYCSSGCYCGYVESRSASEFQSYISGISQKSVMVITNE